MAQRLVKVAKELNVGTTSIVEHLISAGFEIENKPSAKITDDMYNELLKEFQGSLAVKEKADQLILGSRQAREEEKVEPPKPQPAPQPVVKKEEPKPEPVPEPEVKKQEEPAKEEKSLPKPNVVGKIDLDALNKPKKKEVKKEEPKLEEAEPVAKKEEPKPEEAEPAPKDEPTVAKKEKGTAAPKEDEMIRAKTPQLKGLKILGKIDADKLKEPKKERPSKSDDDSNRKKRKRTRKKVAAGPGMRGGRGRQDGGKGRQDEVKEVTEKEIEQSIKATMARLSGGGKSRRQKIRRDKRDEMREKEELKAEMEESTTIEVTEFISVSELASLLDVSPTDVIMTCMNLGVIVSINQRLDAEIIELVAEEYDKEIEFISADDTEEEEEIEDDPADLEPRAPIVTVMGHVDHGKTSLLDYIRKATVAEGEAGGITQHIGAYEVKVGDKRVTFLDTPGHEAFTAMRARGAKVTDVVVVIIAADDRIMPQTKEAISHAQAAGVPIIFAINKVDKPGANPEKIKEELSAMNFLVEDWGGKYQSQDISAKTGQGIDELLEKITLEAELLELKANPNRMAVGTVIEASLDKGRGYVTKMLVQSGTLNIGDAMVAGEHSGKVKAMFNEHGKKIKKAGPSTPVLVLGLGGAPQAGEKFKVMESEQEARQIASKRAQISREQTNRAAKRVSLDEIGRRLALGSFKELNLIIKGDVDGSIEALSDSLIKLSVESVQVNVIHKAVGQITESDVLLATASDAIIIGFQVRPSSGARNLAEKEGVEIKTYSIIYEAIDQIKSAIEGMLEPTQEEKIVGQLDVRDIFKISRVGTIAGCFVTEGYIKRNSMIRLIRDGIVIYPAKEGQSAEIGTLKRFKDDVREVKNGMECGLTIKNFNDIKVGDQIEVFEIEEIAQSLD
jgi:translation initiation factor IF-2